MKYSSATTRRPRVLGSTARLGSISVFSLVDLLLLAAFAVDLLTPFFVWKGYLPGQASWFTHMALVAAIAVAYAQIMISNRIPGAVWAVAGISAIGIINALARGQGLTATFWGWWELFKFPLVGLYAYVRPNWPERFGQWLLNLCLAILGFEVLFQLAQYATGEVIGDNLAGTLGWHGDGPLLFLSLFTVSLALGRWVTHGQWKRLVFALVLGFVSGVLAENKFFPVAAVMMTGMAMLLLAFVVRGGRTGRVLLLAVSLSVGLLGFSSAYDRFIVDSGDLSYVDRILDPDYRDDYLNRVVRSEASRSVRYQRGRIGYVMYAFETISGEPSTLLWGYGLGARSESKSLGTSGLSLRLDKTDRGTELTVLIQEMGLFGLSVLVGFSLWVAAALLRDARRYSQSPATPLRYSLLLFSLLWLVWLWYKNPLASRSMMLLYWVSLGYVLGEARRHERSLSLGDHQKG